MSIESKKQIALVTGASRGIGRAIAMVLARHGFFVVGTATAAKGLATIEKTMSENAFEGKAYLLDIADKCSIKAFGEQLEKNAHIPSVLVNNAGITRDNLLMRMQEDEWEAVVNTNLNSMYHLCKLCIRQMVKKRYGRIINMSSISGLCGNAGQTNYAAAKAAIIGFTRSLAKEVGKRNITVNAVAPGFIETDMTSALSETLRNDILQNIPLHRFGTPMEIANTVAFLASAEAAYINGETINVSGGMYMG